MERSAQTDAESDQYGQIQQLCVAEVLMQTAPQFVADGGVVDGELFGELHRQSLSWREFGDVLVAADLRIQLVGQPRYSCDNEWCNSVPLKHHHAVHDLRHANIY